jgi:hypothetical protein
MLSRLTFLVLTVFWLTMTYFLWRSEYVGHNQVGSSVPINLVWKKIQTASDVSPLQMIHHGQKVGYCRWASSVGQDLSTSKILTDESMSPESILPTLDGYRLNLEGNVALEDMPGRLGFDFEIRFSTNDVWQDFHLRVKLQKNVWELHSRASEQTVYLVMEEGRRSHTERVFKFSELENPQTLLQEFDLPGPLNLLGAFGSLPMKTGTNDLSVMPEITWKARNDWVTMGHTSVRAYRIEASIFDRYRMLIVVSRVGEILRVDLPDGWQLINDQISSL